jgi:hypothetical protein
MHRVILILIAGLTLIITACASQKTQQPPGANFPDPNGFAPPPLPAASSAPAPATSATATPQTEQATAAEKPGAAAVAAAPPAVLEAAEPSADPVPELTDDRAAGKVEELGEISSSTAGPPPSTQPCNMDNCGVIVAIYKGKPQLDVEPDWGWGMYSDPYYGYGPYVGGGIDAWDSPVGPFDSGYVVATAPALWQIEVQMNTGSKRLIQQNYRPFLQLGDPVLVEGNNIRLWN